MKLDNVVCWMVSSVACQVSSVELGTSQFTRRTTVIRNGLSTGQHVSEDFFKIKKGHYLSLSYFFVTMMQEHVEN